MRVALHATTSAFGWWWLRFSSVLNQVSRRLLRRLLIGRSLPSHQHVMREVTKANWAKPGNPGNLVRPGNTRQISRMRVMLYDHLCSAGTPSTLQDKRSAVCVLVIRESLKKTGCAIRWPPTGLQLDDGLTKFRGDSGMIAKESSIRFVRHTQ